MSTSLPAPSSKFRVLVIEDDGEVARLILLNLARAGLDCRYAPDGATGVTAFKEADPHLILLDLMMPGLDGRAVCIKIRETSTLPIIIMTALSGEEPQLQCFKLGADDFVTKPFNPKLLVARVVAHLRRVYAYDVEPETGEPIAAPPTKNSLPATRTSPPATKTFLPAGHARCDACGFSGPQLAFEARVGDGGRSMQCPQCRRRDDIVVSLG